MATLGKIRSMGAMLVIVIGLALFAFIIGDFLNSGSTYFGQSRMNVAKVDDAVMKIDKFQEEVDEFSEIYQMQSGNTQLTEDINAQIRETVFENFVHERLLDKEAAAVGISVTSKELFELVSGENPHPIIAQNFRMFYDENGRFDRSSFLTFLNSMNMQPANAQQAQQLASTKNYWKFWENRVKYNQLEQKIVTLLTKAIVVNDLEAQMAFDKRKTSADIAYVLRPYAAIADSTVAVSQKEVNDLYALRKETFKQENNRDIKYIVYNVKPSEDDFARAKDWMERQKEEFTTSESVEDLLNSSSDIPYMNYRLSAKDIDPDFSEFAFSSAKDACTDILLKNNVYKMARVLGAKVLAPDSVRLRHIFVYEQDEATAAKVADSLLNVLKGGADFAELAANFSRNSATAANGGEIGWVKETNVEKEMIQPCFYGSEKLFVVKTLNGTHVMEVEEKTANVEKVQLAVLARAVEPSSNTFGMIYNQINNFITENNTAEKFEANAENAGYNVRSFNGLSENMQRLGQLGDSRKVVRWVFEADEKDVSEVFTCDDAFVVAVVDKIHKKGFRTQKEVEPTLRAELAKDKKAEMLSAELKAVGNDLESVANKYQTTVDTLRNLNFAQPSTQIGFEPRLAGVVPTLKEGAVEIVPGTRGVFMLKALSTTNSEASFDAENEKQQLGMKYQYIIPQAYFSVLRAKADVEDNRCRFY